MSHINWQSNESARGRPSGRAAQTADLVAAGGGIFRLRCSLRTTIQPRRAFSHGSRNTMLKHFLTDCPSHKHSTLIWECHMKTEQVGRETAPSFFCLLAKYQAITRLVLGNRPANSHVFPWDLAGTHFCNTIIFSDLPKSQPANLFRFFDLCITFFKKNSIFVAL